VSPVDVAGIVLQVLGRRESRLAWRRSVRGRPVGGRQIFIYIDHATVLFEMMKNNNKTAQENSYPAKSTLLCPAQGTYEAQKQKRDEHVTTCMTW
jgi:hypothetical protein